MRFSGPWELHFVVVDTGTIKANKRGGIKEHCSSRIKYDKISNVLQACRRRQDINFFNGCDTRIFIGGSIKAKLVNAAAIPTKVSIN